ncbi:MAG: hypothetical protein QM730_14010 [Anaerolineales bacterium]
MKDNLGLYFLTSLISAVVGAITPILVEIFKEWRKSRNRKKKKEFSVEQEEQPVEEKDTKKKRIINSVGIGILIGIIVGVVIAFLIIHFCTSSDKNEVILWNFDKDIKDWTYFRGAQDAARGCSSW